MCLHCALQSASTSEVKGQSARASAWFSRAAIAIPLLLGKPPRCWAASACLSHRWSGHCCRGTVLAGTKHKIDVVFLASLADCLACCSRVLFIFFKQSASPSFSRELLPPSLLAAWTSGGFTNWSIFSSCLPIYPAEGHMAPALQPGVILSTSKMGNSI